MPRRNDFLEGVRAGLNSYIQAHGMMLQQKQSQQNQAYQQMQMRAMEANQQNQETPEQKHRRAIELMERKAALEVSLKGKQQTPEEKAALALKIKKEMWDYQRKNPMPKEPKESTGLTVDEVANTASENPDLKNFTPVPIGNGKYRYEKNSSTPEAKVNMNTVGGMLGPVDAAMDTFGLKDNDIPSEDKLIYTQRVASGKLKDLLDVQGDIAGIAAVSGNNAPLFGKYPQFAKIVQDATKEWWKSGRTKSLFPNMPVPKSINEVKVQVGSFMQSQTGNGR